ncbi:hypothetical protein AGABI1DRAFT_74269 [Agaricus bisporus var. burnettii JB137-S8]|uniref:Glycosyltransferase 61 catalytic domain-containing protein n=2 Tax=Agaricus bisporus var. burnettii TaxID=192524 RepID=K5WV22_AGABU|nr:uncharacterized protein AGABI1DRAFT_74269 [Agaricus bisporus var. burnettii JB137-S8]EKM79326.1 hypothetical protein AGABI1DRAFT_74269 [Agaricus bisporus var. burnettii JB137-S8]KAF7768100.1 hypothetical protein Agabi119p4_7343 [Agaricus bisporus var. burnettii]
MHQLFPTRREFALVLLFLLLLVLLNRGPGTSYPPNVPSSSRRHTLQAEQPALPQTQLSWKNNPVPQTKLVAHVPGWTIFDRLYVFKGVVYIVSDDEGSLPHVQFILSRGIQIENGQEAELGRLPTDEDIRIISTEEARRLFGVGASILDGVTLFVNDPHQFITHYYHWSAELWFGFWRTYSTLDTTITSDGNTTLPFTRRIMFNHLDAHHWRDYAHMNEWVVRSSFPSATMEFMDDWRDRAELGKPFVFDRIVIADRSAAMRSYNFQRYQRTASAAFALPGSVNWWMPIRNNVIKFARLDSDTGGGTTGAPVITYISRQQWGRRMLIPEHHEKLVHELHKLRDVYGYEVNIVEAENMSRVEQIRLAARTTVMMGVHGNGLTSLVWMKPNPRSTVMEFFYPQGFAHDYEFTTRALGMTHYGFWGNQSFTSPDLPLPQYVEGFQGNSIPIDAEAVARLCVERLSLNFEVDD